MIAGKLADATSHTDKPTAEPQAVSLEVELRKTVAPFSLDVRFRVGPGITILFGRSGSGKTTILDCIAGLVQADAGRISLGGKVLFEGGVRNVAVARRRVGYVFQTLALFPHMTVEQNIEYGLGQMPRAVRRQRVRAMAESFHIDHLLDRVPRQISGGERQRVALARSLVPEPELLLLDEPMSALDRPIKSRIIEDLRAWNQAHQIPVLYVTHSRREVYALGEQVLVLENGRILAFGTPNQVLEAPRQETVAQLADFDNIFDVEAVTSHESHGTMTCRLRGAPLDLEVPLTRMEGSSTMRVAIRSGDIMVAAVQPQQLSARNVIPGTIHSITQQGVSYVLEVDCGVEVRVKLTRSACESLGLQVGHRVWLVIKTHSCHFLRRT